MRRFLRTRLGRATSQLLVAALVLPNISLAAQAQAVVGDGPGTLPRWAVLDFVNRSDVGGGALARQAADAIALELNKTDRYNISQRSAVEQEIRNQGLTPPLSRLGYLRLGNALDVESIVVGAVELVRVTGNPRVAQVVVSVRVVDVASGQEINGAYGDGRSTPRPGYSGDDDALIQEALSLAAFDAVNTVRSYTLPTATVLNTTDRRNVLLNRGSRAGLKEGMRMVVTRGREEVGTLRITRVDANDSTAEVVSELKGIAPQDKAQAIFELPELRVTRDGVTAKAPRARGGANIGRTIWPLIVVAAVAFGIFGRGASGGNTATDNITAEAIHVTSNSPVLPAFGPGVRVSWATNLFAKGTQQQARWLIYRNDFSPFNQEGGRNVPVGAVDGTQHYFVDETAARTVSWPNVPRDGGTDLDDTDTENVPGVTPGRTYIYSVALVYSLPPSELSEDEDTQYRQSDAVNSGPATPLNLPTTVTPANNSSSTLLSNIRFTWDRVAGANQYFVEVSTSPLFQNTNGNIVYTIGPIFSTATTGTQSTDPVDLRSIFANFGGSTGASTPLYWRVGARRAEDSPGPVGDIHGHRFIFSTPAAFSAPDFPPPPGQ